MKRQLAVLTCACTVLSAQTRWSTPAHTAPVSIVGEHSCQLRGGEELALPAGEYGVHFGTDAEGKPLSLQLRCEAGDSVRIAVARAAPAQVREIPLQGEQWQANDLATGTQPTHGRTTGDAAAGDYRISATVRTSGTEAAFGLIARRTEHGYYRLLWDRVHGELRLDRRLGTDDMVLARVAMPVHDDAPHTLALQLHGFRLTAFVDEARVLEELDGACTTGAVGIFWSGQEPTWQRFVIEPVAAARGSAAIVQHQGAATFFGSAVVSPSNLHVLELVLDRPHPSLLRTANGMEPWLLQRPAAPECLLADWRDSLGAGGVGELDRTGLFTSELRWPDLPALRHQACLVRAVLVTTDGDAVAAVTPAVPLVF